MGMDGYQDKKTPRIWLVLESLAVFALGAALMAFLYSAPGPSMNEIGAPGHDSFYHTKMAAMIPEYGLVDTFPWLQYSYFTDEGNSFVSHHYGFHVLMVPFVHAAKFITGDYLPGGRWAICAFFGAILMTYNWLLMAAGVRWRWIWLALFMFLPDQFFTRNAFIRAIAPSLMMMLFLVLALVKRRYAVAGILIALYVHVYLGGLLYAPWIVIFFFLAHLLGPADDRRFEWTLPLWTLGGWLVGAMTYPYAGVFEFLQLQVFGSGLSPDIPVGREWRPYTDAWYFARMAGPLLIVWGLSLIIRLRTGPRLSANELALVMVNFFFLAFTAKMRRSIEYWPPFCLLSAAYMMAPITQSAAEAFKRFCQRHRGAGDLFLPRGARIAWTGALTLVLAGGTALAARPVWKEIRKSTRCNYNLPAIREMMAYLKDHSEPGEIVFTDDWDDFPVFFYHNSNNYFCVGLDPKFTHERRPDLWDRYVKVSRGEVPSSIMVDVKDERGNVKRQRTDVRLTDIRDHFHARWVITDRDHRALASKLANDESFAELVWPTTSYTKSRSAPYLLFRVRESDEPVTPKAKPQADDEGRLYLSWLDPVSIEQEWGELQIDRSVENGPLRIGEKVYLRGLGTHAHSKVLYEIPEGFTFFQAEVGVDRETNGLGSIRASVFLDGQRVFQTPVLTGDSPATIVRVPLGGARQVMLQVDDAGDGNRFDHADWADARFVREAQPQKGKRPKPKLSARQDE